MLGLLYTESEEASRNSAEYMVERLGFKGENGVYTDGKIKLLRVEGRLVDNSTVDSLGLDTAIFLSRHSSSAGIRSLTAHSLGNWGNGAELGGVPMKLSVAAPAAMLSVLKALSSLGMDGFEKGYEATHHGPLTETPSFFAELGGDAEVISNRKIAETFADAVYRSALEIAEERADYTKVVVGIGGGHYPGKFSRLAVEKGYAFAHIMPKHAVSEENIAMLGSAFERSNIKPESAVIEWKSMNAATREIALKRLQELGIEHERV